MGWLDAIGGATEGLQQMLARRMLEQQLAREVQQQELDNRLRQRQVDHDNRLRQRQVDQGDRRMEQDDREFGLRQNQFGLEQMLANRPPPPERPITMGAGQHLVDPTEGRIIMQTPPAERPPERPISLAPGGRLVDSAGRLITSAPERPPAPQKSLADELAEFEAKEQIKAKYQGAKPSLGSQRTALGYFNRMLEAERNARGAEDKLAGGDLAAQQYAPGWLENWLQSQEGQAYTQAQRMFTEARLRKESGAAIPPQEFESDRKTNFRIAGDTPETVKQKRRARFQTMRGIGNTAGRALQEYYGDDATLDSLLKEFEDQQAPAPQRRPIPGVPGGEAELRNGKWIRVQ